MSLSYRDGGFWEEIVRRGVIALVTLIPCWGVMEPLVLAETAIIPALSVSGTYDSNVFYTPKSLLPAGTKPEDYYMSITPQITAAHRGSSIDGSLTVGAIITKYKDNPVLDYTGINAAGAVDLKNLVYKVVPRIETLSIIGSYQFTPSVSAFGASGLGSVGTGFGSTGFAGPLDAGLITNRVSMHNYTGTINGAYQLTPVTSMTGGYSYNQISFGTQSGGLSNPLFDTVGHSGNVALSTRVNPKDSVGTTGFLSHYEQSGNTGGGSGSFTTITGMVTWSRQWTRELSASLGGGGILTLPIETGIPGGKVKSTVTPAIATALTYTSYSEGLKAAGASLSSLGSSALGPFEGLPKQAGTLSPGGILAPGRYSASMSYNLSVFPSYAIGAGPITAHVIGANATGGIMSNLTGQVGANFSHGSGTAPLQSFDTLGVTAGLNYLFASSFLASVSYNWLYFSSSVTQSPGALSDELAFSKKMVTLSISYVFSSRPFFRTGGFSGFGKAGSSGPIESIPGGITDPKKTK